MPPVQVSEQDVAKKIRELRRDAAAGPDGVTPRLLKDYEKSLALPLEILFNKSRDTLRLETANVTPIFKKGVKGDPGNYRLVSLTSVPCKVLESIIKDKLMQY